MTSHVLVLDIDIVPSPNLLLDVTKLGLLEKPNIGKLLLDANALISRLIRQKLPPVFMVQFNLFAHFMSRQCM